MSKEPRVEISWASLQYLHLRYEDSFSWAPLDEILCPFIAEYLERP